MIRDISVLIVEDNPLAAKIVERLLLEKKCVVDMAENGLTAIEKFKHSEYELVFMDIGLPDLTGFEVTTEIRKHEKNYRHSAAIIIGLTAAATEENIHLGLKSGMNEVLAKPLTHEILDRILIQWDKAQAFSAAMKIKRKK